MDSSSEFGVNHPINDGNFKHIPGCIWRELEMKIARLAPDDPFIPGSIGGLLGFWLSTLIFSFDLLLDENSKYMYLSFCFLWVGSLIVYLTIYRRQRELIRGSKEEILHLIKESDRESWSNK